jgi:hypothetical protein
MIPHVKVRPFGIVVLIAALGAAVSGVAAAQCLDNDGSVRSITDTWDFIDSLNDRCVLSVTQDSCAPSPPPTVTVAAVTCTIASTLTASGTIDLSASPAVLTLSGSTNVSVCTSLTASGTSTDLATFTGSGACSNGTLTLPLTFTMTRRCGNGTLDSGEDCQEPGAPNPAGPCCSSSNCRLKPANTPCVPESFGRCVFDTGMCSGDSSQGCAAALPCDAGASRSRAVLTNRADPARNSLLWRWRSSAAVEVSDLALAADSSEVIDLCAADADGVVQSVHEVGGGLNWTPTANKGFRFRDRALAQDGIAKIVLRSGAAGKAAIIVRGRGPNLGAPALPLSTPARVYLLLRPLAGAQFDRCWDATYDAADVNTASEFKAKLP